VNAIEFATLAALGLPLLAALANGLSAGTGDRLYGHRTVARVAVAAVFASFLASAFVAVAMMLDPVPREVTLYRFISSGDFAVDFGLLVDPLSVVMMFVVTGISALVTRFSVNYMHNEVGFSRYFTVVPLFVFAMLVLVLADNYLVMFLGWEGVGVCSYLLIGFYRDRPASAQAATKAFVMNRVGDAALLIAMFLLVAHTGSLQYGEVFAQAPALPGGVAAGVGFLLLLGATGKSAQLPLGTWLAQAMEGPTPSSALIHAATMVTAGVYLVVRSAPIYDYAPTALLAVGIVGAITVLYGQLVGYVQTEIKGVLAASTTAQLGLMFLFCGLGLYGVAIFHLVAHAFYKSYLFLTAPSILHHLHGGPDPSAVRRPTDTARLLGAVALALAAGILVIPLVARVFQPTGIPAWNLWAVLALGVIAAFAAIFSAWRMTRLAFAGHADSGHEPHVDGTGETHASHAEHHPGPTHTGRLVAPLAVLAGLVTLGLLLDVLPGGLPGSWFNRLLGDSAAGTFQMPQGDPLVMSALLATVALLMISGWYGPRYFDRLREELPATAGSAVVRRLYWWGVNRGYLDDWYNRAVVAPTHALGRALERFDRGMLERFGAPFPPEVGAPSATWESRFLALRSAHAAGATVLAEPPARLDWLAPTDGAGIPSPARTGRVDAAAGARPAEGAFQTLDMGTLKLAGFISAFIEAVEQAVFQVGLGRGLDKTATGVQRGLLAIERRLGHPLVIGSILVLWLLALIAGTR
jgi:NADH-quinone oxidoreductase subunit L